MKLAKKGFTLVELIVVITILAILATIGFMSMQGFALSARESSRMTNISTIMRALDYTKLRTGTYPTPDNATTISASGAIIGYQGFASRDVLNAIGYPEEGLDPLDKTHFSYYVLADQSAYQMLALMENSDSLRAKVTHTAHADFSDRYPKTFGKKLGILTDDLNVPVQNSIGVGTLDITMTSTGYTAHLSDQDKVTGSGETLRQSVPRASCKRLYDLDEAGLDGYYTIYPIDENPVEVYCNMTDEGGGLTMIARSVQNASFNGTPFGWFVSRGTPQDDTQPYSLGSAVQDIPFEKVYLTVYTSGKEMSGAPTTLTLNDVELFNGTYFDTSLAVDDCEGAGCALFGYWGNFGSQESYFFSPANVDIDNILDLSDLGQYAGNQRDGLNRLQYGATFPFPGIIYVK